MSECHEPPNRPGGRISAGIAVALCLLVSLGAYLRFSELGARSLWLDEFSTWHVSRMALGESLRWQPELTKPPLYQICLRRLSDDPRPSEFVLRLPAAVAGVLSIAAAFWIGRLAGGWAVGLGLAALVACNMLQIDQARQARSYSMLLLGTTVSTALFYRVVQRRRLRDVALYVISATLTLHAHYLMVLTIVAHALWWLFTVRLLPKDKRSLRPPAAMVLTVLLCTPMVAHYFRVGTSVTQGLGWIDPPTWGSTFDVLGSLTVGWPWMLALLLPSLIIWVAWTLRHKDAGQTAATDVCGLLITWFVTAWLGLLAISWLGQPAMITRYALPAAIPALLLPLVVAHRIDWRAPLIIAGLFIAGTAPDWINAPRDVAAGFRELRNYLAAEVDPKSEAVVLIIDALTYPDWPEMERLAFEYYPLSDRPVHELIVGPDSSSSDDSILFDPRALHLIVFRADPTALIDAAGREVRSVEHDGTSYSRRLFEPYRIIEVSPLSDG